MKRKFKILIMAISIVAMLFSFAIVSSAAEVAANEDELLVSVGYIGGEGYDDNFSFNPGSVMITYTDFKIIIVSTPFSNSVDYVSFHLIGVEAFYNEITANVDNPNAEGEIYNYLSDTYDVSCESSVYYYGHIIYQKVCEYMNRATEEDLEAKYNEGKLAGAEEFKSSEEYTNTINLAKESGIDEYKASDEYASLLNSKYNEGHISGTAAGITAYKSSTEYKKALSAEYDEGYDAGFEDGENTFDFAPLIVGIVFLGAIAITLVFINKKRKKNYHR